MIEVNFFAGFFNKRRALSCKPQEAPHSRSLREYQRVYKVRNKYRGHLRDDTQRAVFFLQTSHIYFAFVIYVHLGLQSRL